MNISDFEWENLANPKLALLRQKYNLEAVVNTGKTEYEKQLLLKDWVHNILPRGDPIQLYYEDSALEILEDAQKGFKMYCTQYAFVYLQCAQALGWQSRKLSIDYDHNIDQRDRHHGIVDIWSTDHNKWYCIDPVSNLHFTSEGVPLNALEIRESWLLDNSQRVKGIVGNFKNKINYDTNSVGHDTPSNYFWIYISLRNNFFEKPGLFSTKGFLWTDSYNREKTWYRNDPAIGEPQIHAGYEFQFIKTNDADKIFQRPNRSNKA